MPGSANQRQGASSTDADSLVRAIQRTHSSFEQAARGQNLIGDDNKVCGSCSAKKDGCCDCNSSFECNICPDMAKQPVVTLCGHLFCWPCLLQWLHAQSPFYECPVCKVEVLEANVTSIYGKGGEEGDSTTNPDLPPAMLRANRRESLRQQLKWRTQEGS
jgi:E3 ubiquitin-protein ligase RNF5